jgi:hypothetical protein
MQLLRHRINPQTFVITLRQIAKHLKINQERIINWEKYSLAHFVALATLTLRPASPMA